MFWTWRIALEEAGLEKEHGNIRKSNKSLRLMGEDVGTALQ